jgi:hypothetical protein
MEETLREEVRQYLGEGLRSLETEDMADLEGNLLRTRLAERDEEAAKTRCNPDELQQLEDTLQALEETPKLAANARDSLLDLEGVRCYPCGRFLIFYRYNSNFNVITLIRLALDHPEWDPLIRDGKPFHENSKHF